MKYRGCRFGRTQYALWGIYLKKKVGVVHLFLMGGGDTPENILILP